MQSAAATTMKQARLAHLLLKLVIYFLILLLSEYIYLADVVRTRKLQSSTSDPAMYMPRHKRTKRKTAKQPFLANLRSRMLHRSGEKLHLPKPRGQPELQVWNETLPFVELFHWQNSTKETRIIYFLHIHKTAGTFLCNAARVNGLVTSRANCNVQRDQKCCGNNDSLQAQQDFAVHTQFQFVANERDMYSGMDTSHYRYVVTLRKSADRYKSHWKNVWRNGRHNLSFSDWWKRQPDNWNVRKICGSLCSEIPKYGLTEWHFQYTLDRLKMFEDILFFEQYQQSFAEFANHVGWTRVPNGTETEKKVKYPPIGEQWDPAMSNLDDALYDYATKLSNRENSLTVDSDTKEIANEVQRYFDDGPSRQCDNPCCAEKCSPY